MSEKKPKIPCPLTIKLAKKTREYMQSKMMSLRQMGELAGMSAQQLHDLLNNAESGATVQLRTAANLAKAIGMKLELR